MYQQLIICLPAIGVSDLPAELKRCFLLIRELDQNSSALQTEVDSRCKKHVTEHAAEYQVQLHCCIALCGLQLFRGQITDVRDCCNISPLATALSDTCSSHTACWMHFMAFEGIISTTSSCLFRLCWMQNPLPKEQGFRRKILPAGKLVLWHQRGLSSWTPWSGI